MLFSRTVLESVLIAGAATAEVHTILPQCDVPPLRSAAELIVEGILPPDGMLLKQGAVPIGADIRSMVEARRMEIRLRIEYHGSSRALVATVYLASPGDSLPGSESPTETSGAVLQMFEANAEFVRGAMARGGSFAVMGTLRKELVPWFSDVG